MNIYVQCPPTKCGCKCCRFYVIIVYYESETIFGGILRSTRAVVGRLLSEGVGPPGGNFLWCESEKE